MSAKRKPGKRRKVAVRKPMPQPSRAHRDNLEREFDRIWRLLKKQHLDD